MSLHFSSIQEDGIGSEKPLRIEVADTIRYVGTKCCQRNVR